MRSLHERILIWRFSNSVPKFLLGFFLKAIIEAGLAIGLLVAAFILSITWFFEVSFSSILPYSPPATQSKIVAWILLTGWLWTQFRCIMAEGKLPEPIRDEVMEERLRAHEDGGLEENSGDDQTDVESASG